MNSSLNRTINLPSILIAVLAAAWLAAAAPAHAGVHAQVTNSTEVSRARYDDLWGSIVSLRSANLPAAAPATSDNTRHSCAGTLIRPDVVLTAAHCVTDDSLAVAGHRTVLVGTRRLSPTKRSYGESIPVAETAIHPNWRGSTSPASSPGWDVALLHLVRPATRGTTMQLIGSAERDLWGGGNGLPIDHAWIAGWGITATAYSTGDDDEAASSISFPTASDPMPTSPFDTQPILREASIPLMSDRLCGSTDSDIKDDAASFDPASMLCGGTADTVKGSGSDRRGGCYGDSGGPLVVRAADGSPRQVGIVSWVANRFGEVCNRTTVFTRIDGVRDWIDTVLGEFDAPPPLSLPASAILTDLGRHAVRVSWPDISGDYVRIRLLQEVGLLEAMSLSDVPERFRSRFARIRLRTEVARGGFGTSALNVRNVAPRHAGSHAPYRFRIEATTRSGRTVLGPAMLVDPLVDSRRPTSPGAVRAIGRLQGAVLVAWRPSVDDDCVAQYALEVRRGGSRRWGTHSTVPVPRCVGGELGDYLSDRDWFEPGWRPTRRALFDLERGTYFIRAVAIDRAGNRGVGRPVRVRVSHYVEDLALDPECHVSGPNVVCVYPKDEY